jgi:hypothetical protein
MTLPNFLIIGAAKSGTTSLYEYLKDHPQVFMPEQKEPKFFALDGHPIDFQGYGDQIRIKKYPDRFINNLEDYKNQFEDVRSETAIGEASTIYLYHPNAHQNIHKYIPEAKFIAILRNPIDRAFSHYVHMVRDGREPLNDFIQACNESKKRLDKNWFYFFDYLGHSFYYWQLLRYFDTFKRDQILVLLNEDLKNDARAATKEIYKFLGVDSEFEPREFHRHNPSGIPKNRRLYWTIRNLNMPTPIKKTFRALVSDKTRERILFRKERFKEDLLVKPVMAEKERQYLKQIFRKDIENLQDLIQRDLSGWLE